MLTKSNCATTSYNSNGWRRFRMPIEPIFVLTLTWVSLIVTALWLRKRGIDIEKSLEEIED